MSEGFYEDPYTYYDSYDEMKPGDAGTEDDENYDPENDLPVNPSFRYTHDELYGKLTGDDEDWPSEPGDWRHGEPAGDEGWS